MVARGSLRTRVRVTYLLHTCPDSLHFFQSKVVYLLRRHVTRDVEPEDLGTTGNKVNFWLPIPSLSIRLFVCLFVCLFVFWFSLPDPALPQEITVVASSVSSFLLSFVFCRVRCIRLFSCLFVGWCINWVFRWRNGRRERNKYVADVSSVSPSSLWRRANDWNVSYCLLHGAPASTLSGYTSLSSAAPTQLPSSLRAGITLFVGWFVFKMIMADFAIFPITRCQVLLLLPATLASLPSVSWTDFPTPYQQPPHLLNSLQTPILLHFPSEKWNPQHPITPTSSSTWPKPENLSNTQTP